ncbi:hypothetical protein [Haloplanus pelagicus]|jgi:hypothetical protein|uniref:hypothetical protein n=1 Tax=Haloplanus pelagicus TaxID=2949995 RepID=UPI00203A439E|nr:hypothetical protein [Haloplanus sp. HW8-1]
MVEARTATAAVGLLASVAVSIAAWYYFDTLLAVLLLPFVPVLFRGRDDSSSLAAWPVCEFTTRDQSVHYCPHDGTALDRRDD